MYQKSYQNLKQIPFIILMVIVLGYSIIFAQDNGKADVQVVSLNAKRIQTAAVPLRVELSLQIKNAGDNAIHKGFIISLSYQRKSEEPWLKFYEWKCASINQNATLNYTKSFDFKESGAYFFKAEIDADNVIADIDKTNNVKIIQEEYAAGLGEPGAAEQLQPGGSYNMIVAAPRMDIPLSQNPATMSVVMTDQLKEMPKSVGADEALALVPGVKVDNQLNNEKVHLSIRGQGILSERGVRGIKVMLDGLPVNDPSGFSPDFYDVDWATVDHIEVMRGPAASLYGSSSTGGVIDIFTKNGGNELFGGDAMVGFGSYGFKKGLAEIGGTSGKVNYRIDFSRGSEDGYRDHSAYWTNKIYSKFNFDVNSKLQLSAIVGWTNYYNENPEGLNLGWLAESRRMANPDSNTFNEFQHTNRVLSGVTGRYAFDEENNFIFSGYLRRTVYTEAVPSSVQHRTLFSPGTMLQYNNNHSFGSLKNHFIVGTDLDWQNVDQYYHPNLGAAVEGPELQSNETIAQNATGIYMIDRLELNPKWSVIFNVRYDRLTNKLTDKLQTGGVDLSGDANFSKSTGRVGIAWNALKNFSAYASWGMGFLPPAIEELGNNPDHYGGFNIHLIPAKSNGEEVGVRGFVGKMFSYDFALFYVRTENDFGRYRTPERPMETFYGNMGSTKKTGFETALTFYPYKSLIFEVAYTYSHFTYITYHTMMGSAYSGTWLPNIPQHQAYIDAQYQFGAHITVGCSANVMSRAYVDGTNATWIDGYALINPRVSYQFKFFNKTAEAMFSIRNLNNKEYIAFTEPDPDGNSYQPAATREFFFNFRFLW